MWYFDWVIVNLIFSRYKLLNAFLCLILYQFTLIICLIANAEKPHASYLVFLMLSNESSAAIRAVTRCWPFELVNKKGFSPLFHLGTFSKKEANVKH